jgi:hypothetical protein
MWAEEQGEELPKSQALNSAAETAKQSQFNRVEESAAERAVSRG